MRGLQYIAVLLAAYCLCLNTIEASILSTHILDTTVGRPAPNVSAVVYRMNGETWERTDTCTTDDDGRCGKLLEKETRCGIYKITFAVDCYFKRTNTEAFYPFVEVVFRISDPSQHYHVPLLLNPFGYSTYRGS